MTNERAIEVLRMIESAATEAAQLLRTIVTDSRHEVYLLEGQEAFRLAIAALREKAGKEN